MTTLILGGSGQMGTALKRLLPTALCPTRAELDLTNQPSLQRYLQLTKPEMIYNAAAYTAVDLAKTEKAQAFRLNAELPQWLAESAPNATIIHYSTDYVFDGSGDAPWRETDRTAPLNYYGQSKRAGEEALLSHPRAYIFRLSWVYDAVAGHKNFFHTMLRLMAERDELSVVNDQIGAPSYAPHLASLTVGAIEKSIPPGLYHLAATGHTSWHGFAEAIRTHSLPLRTRIIHPIPSTAYPTPALRPKNSRMDISKFAKATGITPPSWKEGLDAAFTDLQKS